MRNEEWDWPPPRRTVRREFNELVPPKIGWNSPLIAKFASGYFGFMLLLFKIAFACAVGLALFASLWLLKALFTHN